MATGYYNSSGHDFTLAEIWNGSGWALQVTPNAADAVQSRLDRISCPSTTPCTAVGSYDNTSGQQVTLAEHWDGVSWVIQTTPNTDGATASVLDGVSCPAMTSCTAVAYSRTSAGVFVTLAEVWDGSSWAIQPTPNPSGPSNSYLLDVSCPSVTVCTAVGVYKINAGRFATLVERNQ